jgi:hypothetical protein
MVIAINSSCKKQIGYFLINSPAIEKFNLENICLIQNYY